jgi:hypothetical protein
MLNNKEEDLKNTTVVHDVEGNFSRSFSRLRTSFVHHGTYFGCYYHFMERRRKDFRRFHFLPLCHHKEQLMLPVLRKIFQSYSSFLPKFWLLVLHNNRAQFLHFTRITHGTRSTKWRTRYSSMTCAPNDS